MSLKIGAFNTPSVFRFFKKTAALIYYSKPPQGFLYFVGAHERTAAKQRFFLFTVGRQPALIMFNLFRCYNGVATTRQTGIFRVNTCKLQGIFRAILYTFKTENTLRSIFSVS